MTAGGLMMNTNRIRTLLVEDNPADKRLVQEGLRGMGPSGYDIECADHLATAVDQLQAGGFDVVLLDLSLPDSSGIETLNRVRRQEPRVPIVVLTGLVDEEAALNSLNQGAQDYLLKGEFSGDLLDRAIRYAIERHQVMAENLRLLEEVKASKDELERKNQRLAQLYETAHQFVDNVSHEFRTPLTVIKEFTSIVREGLSGEVNDEQRSCLSIVEDRVDDLAFMVNDMLDISRLEAGLLGVRRRTCRAEQVIERIRTTLERKAAANRIELSISIDPELPDMFGDPEKIGRVIINLTVNALKFSADGGKVDLWARLDQDPSQVTIGVTDNGPGISEEHQATIFERFKQIQGNVRASTQGFGLGLNIAMELVHLNFGSIQVQSKVGEGSTFSFTVPIAEPVLFIRRYLKQVSRIRNGSSYVTLIHASIDPSVGDVLTEEVDTLLQRHMRTGDVAFRAKAGRWVIALASHQSGAEKFIARVQDALREANRNRPQAQLPEIALGIDKTWKAEEQEALIERFQQMLDERKEAGNGHCTANTGRGR